jgi:GNAT superfamily N-acetyltransferase
METGKYKVPTNVVKIPDGDTGYSTVKKNYRRFMWTWNNAPQNEDNDYDPDSVIDEVKSLGAMLEIHEHGSIMYRQYKAKMSELLESADVEDYQVRMIGGAPVYYKKVNDKWTFIDKEEFDSAMSSGYVEEELFMGEIPGMGDSDRLPGGTTGYKSGPLSKNTMMSTDDYMDPDDLNRMKKKNKGNNKKLRMMHLRGYEDFVSESLSDEASLEFYPEMDKAGFKLKGYYDRSTGIAKLGYVKVPSAARNRGAGTKLVSDFEKWAKSLGAHTVEIDAHKDSIDFWKKLGYDVGELEVISGYKQDYATGTKRL